MRVLEVPERVAVVTGGAGAIGASITRALRDTGHRTVILDRDADVACDLSSEASTRAAAATVLERHGRCDVLVHCAAAFDRATIAEVDADTLSPGFTFRGSLGQETTGRQGWRRYRDLIREGSADFHNEIVDLVSDGTRAAARLRFTGTHTGPLLGLPSNAAAARSTPGQPFSPPMSSRRPAPGFLAISTRSAASSADALAM